MHILVDKQEEPQTTDPNDEVNDLFISAPIDKKGIYFIYRHTNDSYTEGLSYMLRGQVPY